MDAKYKTARADSRKPGLISPEALPDSIRNSYLMTRDGYDVFEGLLDSRALDLLLAEAVALSGKGARSDVPDSDEEEVRGGSPARQFINTGGGEVQAAVYHAGWMIDFLSGLCDATVIPTGSHGTYSFYSASGAHIFIHRDVEECDLAVITCLHDNAGSDTDGGMLCLYTDRLFEPLSAIRATPELGATRLRLMPGQTIVLLGGIVPHCVLPVVEGQTRIVSVLCYQIPSLYGNSSLSLTPE
jgi:hypothetical protein